MLQLIAICSVPSGSKEMHTHDANEKLNEIGLMEIKIAETTIFTKQH